MRNAFLSMAACLVAPAMLLTAQEAFAADPIDLGALRLDTDYELEQFQSYVATFTPEETGVMIMSGGENAWYADAECTEYLDGTSGGYVDSKPTFMYEVTSGQTIYFNVPFVMNPTVMRLSMAGNVSLLGVTPEPGSQFSPSGYEYCDFEFSEPVTVSGATVTANGKTENARAMTTGAVVSVSIAEPVLNWLIDGTLKENDEFTVTVAGVKSVSGVLYTETGIVEATFKSSAKPARLVSNNVPTVFDSYYPKGDPRGIFTLTFDENIAPGNAMLGYGNPEGENSEYYQEEVPYTVDGGMITVDLTGKRRTAQDMVPSGTDYGIILLSFPNVKDTSGNLAWSEGSGSLGSYFFQMDYNQIRKAQILADFSPVNGSSLNGVNEISVWISGLDYISFDGFHISYSDGSETNSVVIPLADCKTDGKGNEIEYTFAVPEAVKGKKNVVVTLENVVSKDGYDHSGDVTATYDGFVLTYVDPANGSRMEMLKEGTIITVKTNITAEYPDMYIMYEIEDLDATNPDQAIIKSQSWMTRQEDGSYQAEVWGNYKMLVGHNYRVSFTAWESEEAKNYQQPAIGTAYVTWEGLSQPFQYSQIVMKSVDPVPGSTLTAENNVITFMFDGLVTTDNEHSFINTGMGTQLPFDKVEAVDPYQEAGVTYSNEWRFTISGSFIEGSTADIYTSFQFSDMDGKIVKGSDGEEENSYFMYVYEVGGKYADFNVDPAAESELASLSEIVVSSLNGENIGLSYATETPVVMTMQGGVVATVAEVEEIPEDGSSLRLVLDNEITAEGTYLLHIPAGYIIIGEEFSSLSSIEKDIVYYVKNGSAPGEFEVVADPAEGIVDRLEAITLTFPTYDSAGCGAGRATLSIDGQEAETLPDAEYGIDMNQMVQPMGRVIDSKGTYTISFPAGYFNLGDNGDASPAFELTYVIGQTAVSDIEADSNGRYEVYDASGVCVLSTDSADDLRSLGNGFYIINGVKTLLRK